MYLIIERTSSVVDFGVIFNVYFTWTFLFLINVAKQERLLARASPTCTVQFTALRNKIGAWQIQSTLFHTYSSANPHGRRQIRIQEFYFLFSYNVLINSLCTVNIMSLDTDLILWKLSRLLNDDKQCSHGEKDTLHKTWAWKHPKLIGNKNCIGGWICLAMLEEKLPWTSINLQDLSTTKNDPFGNIVEHIVDL